MKPRPRTLGYVVFIEAKMAFSKSDKIRPTEELFRKNLHYSFQYSCILFCCIFRQRNVLDWEKMQIDE